MSKQKPEIRFEMDPAAVARAAKVMQQLSDNLNQAMFGVSEAIGVFSRNFHDDVLDAFNHALSHIHRQRTIEERLNIFGWQDVDPHELSPEERWEYQRWIMAAPARWVRRLIGQ